MNGVIVAVAVALPFLASVLLTRKVPGWRYVPVSTALASLGLLLPTVLPALEGEVYESVYPWVPSLGIEAGFYVDAFSALFAIVIAAVGSAIFLYSTGYMRGDRAEYPFYRLMLFFMGSMLGVALSRDLLTLFVFWEMTSLSSFMLVGLYSSEARSIYSARKALLVTVSGGIALLAGFVIIGDVAGTTAIPELLSSDALRESAMYPLILLLVLVGAGAKAAQFPLHVWLPDAMVAPTPVSAYLHSAAMVKAGVFLLGRVSPFMGSTPLWETVLPAVGLTTMVVAGFLAVRSRDLKELLAYSTASHLGLITAVFGWGFTLGGVLHLVNHASFKSALFLVAGIVMHETGARSFDEVGGLWRSLPVTAAVAGVAAFSMAGLPPFGGFVSKELFYEAAAGEGALLAASAVLAGLLSFLYSMKFFLGTFGGEERREAHGEPLRMVLPVAVLVLPTALLGLSGAAELLSAAAEAVGAVQGHGGLWHGLTLPLGMSAATVALGGAAYLRLDRVSSGVDRAVGVVGPVTPDALYDGFVEAVPRLSLRLESRAEDRGLRKRLRWMVLAAAPVLLLVFMDGVPALPAFGAGPAVLVSGGLAVAAGLYLVRVKSHVLGTVMLALVGYSVALLFVFAGGPDLALTQVIVETLAFVIMLLVVQRLPAYYGEHRFRPWDAAVAGAVGASVFVLAAVEPVESRLADFFVEKAVSVAGGHNVVNVILVDFRALDTLGEITVIAVAGLGALALMKGVLE